MPNKIHESLANSSAFGGRGITKGRARNKNKNFGEIIVLIIWTRSNQFNVMLSQDFNIPVTEQFRSSRLTTLTLWMSSGMFTPKYCQLVITHAYGKDSKRTASSSSVMEMG